eukprot:1482893-Pleurochrysis_carterae.AAC.1
MGDSDLPERFVATDAVNPEQLELPDGSTGTFFPDKHVWQKDLHSDSALAWQQEYQACSGVDEDYSELMYPTCVTA